MGTRVLFLAKRINLILKDDFRRVRMQPFFVSRALKPEVLKPYNLLSSDLFGVKIKLARHFGTAVKNKYESTWSIHFRKGKKSTGLVFLK